MTDTQINNPMHGVTLEKIVNSLVDHYGWEKLGRMVNIKCFRNNPSVISTLKFLRKTPWARTKVEKIYLDMKKKDRSNRRRFGPKKTGNLSSITQDKEPII